MQFQDNPFASLQQSQFGQMAGPGGFAGGGGGFGQMLPQMGGMFGAPKKGGFGGGFNPMMLSPLAYAFHKDPKIGFAMLSPALGIANLLGAFK